MLAQSRLGCSWVKVRLFRCTLFSQVHCQGFVSCRRQAVRVWVEGACCPTGHAQWSRATTCNGMAWHVSFTPKMGVQQKLFFHICAFGRRGRILKRVEFWLRNTYLISSSSHAFCLDVFVDCALACLVISAFARGHGFERRSANAMNRVASGALRGCALGSTRDALLVLRIDRPLPAQSCGS